MNFEDNSGLGLQLYMEALKDMEYFHRNQYDKSGYPYFLHPLRVASTFVEENDASAAIVGLLHDIVEDTNCTVGYIEDRYPEEIVEAVEAITRNDSETYKQYVKRCCKNSIARKVKEADVFDNLRPERSWGQAPLERYWWTIGYIDCINRREKSEVSS